MSNEDRWAIRSSEEPEFKTVGLESVAEKLGPLVEDRTVR